MGRPIKKKFFGNINPTQYGSHVQGTGVGGEGVSQLNVSNSGTLYSQGAVVTIAAPNITGGNRATVSTTINGSGNVAIAITNAGTGYTSAPAVTITTATGRTVTATAVSGESTLTSVSSVAGLYVGMRLDGSPGVQTSTYISSIGTTSVTLTKTMTASTSSNSYLFSDVGASFASTTTLFVTGTTHDAIQITSYIPGGGAARTGGDIIKQESSRRYLVQNSDGVGACKLVADTPAAGEMNIIATDAGGATYYVTKLTGRKATLTNKTDTSTAYYVTGEVAPWTIDSASGSTAPTAIVSISNTN
jgi:hypothetical protein